MTEEGKTIDGTITQISPWKNGKGTFVKIDSIETDFFKFGGFASKEGETVRLHYRKGSNAFSDKFEIIRTELLVEGAEPKPVTKEQAEFKTADKLLKPKPQSNDLAGVIRRSVTIKCASTIVAAFLERGEPFEVEPVVEDVIKIAKALEKYIEKGESD